MKTKITGVLILLNFFFYQEVKACTCPPPAPVKDEIKRSDMVITGKVISKQPVESFETMDVNKGSDSLKPVTTFQYKEMLYTIVITKKHKGNFRSDTITVLTGLGGADCGYEFKVGQKYIVYGRLKQRDDGVFKYMDFPRGTYTTTICTRTKPYTKKEEAELKKALKN